MSNPNLHAIIRIKTMARAAVESGPTSQLTRWEWEELAEIYMRLREEARALHERAGWGSGKLFDKEIPPLDRALVGAIQRGLMDRPLTPDPLEPGRRAVVLLRQLAAWAEGHQQAFEIEAGLQASAEARAKAQSSKQQIGFRAD